MTGRQPLALVTNDDGIRCGFLHELVSALAPKFRVVVAAPAGERSWIGRAFSREGEVPVTPAAVAGAEMAWAIVGTPSDCVNIALGHLLDERPDIVLSGINIGFNVSMPLILSSGTVAGATEGAAQGVRAAAFSLDLKPHDFERLRLNGGMAENGALATLRTAATRAAAFASELVGAPAPHGLSVHNYNFPSDCGASTPVTDTEPALIRTGKLFEPAKEKGSYAFRWSDGVDLTKHRNTDVAALSRGEISHTLLDFSSVGRTFGSKA